MTVVVFGHEKGGVGKTSLALNFTVMAAEAGVDVVLLDTDRQQSSLNWLGLRVQSPDLPAISILSNSADPLREVDSLSKRYQLVVCDIGAQSYKALVECALLADMYVIPTGTSDMDLTPAEDLLTLLNRLKPVVPGQKINARCVITKAPGHPGSQEVQRTRERLAAGGHSVFDTVITHRSSWRSMANTGRAIQELKGKAKDDKARSEMEAFYAEIVEALANQSQERV